MSITNSAVRPQFGHWLLEQVQSGQYGGLYMIDRDTFRIPWKHNSRKDCGDEDNQIFREWAVVSGKISEYPNDKAKWKTNFRCALNSLTQFKMIQDNSKTENPHKIYRIIRPENHQQCSRINTEALYSSSNNQYEEMEYDLPNQIETLDINTQPPEIQYWPDYQQPIQHIEDNTNYSVPQMQVLQQHCLLNNTPVSAPVLLQLTHNIVPQPFILPSIFELEISIHYRKMEMLKRQVKGPHIQLHTQCDQSELRGVSVPFPSTDELTDHKQVHFTKHLLNNISRGLLLEVCPSGIYGYRQDKCNVFFSTCNPTEIPNPEPRKLPQSQNELLFSFDKYKKDLIDFKENRRGSPEYTIYLCFGERFPDGKPLERKLIVVKVVPLICRELHKAAQLEGASSLQNDNISLQLSHNSLYELIEATFSPPPAV
ncbi:interferon regulatory factor 7 [Tachysurus fulvidraco]|uniref:interferon regulatory factor 7 n=1 Tax=Tachysurus fulvidraco TaxID=1234273 RepID=UPI000F50C803|nr:interferon regulatory factor 7 [Tachysurus fulvidraco]